MQPMLLVHQDIFQHALDEDEDVDRNVSNLMFIQDLHQITDCVKALCIKFIKDKDKGWLLVT